MSVQESVCAGGRRTVSYLYILLRTWLHRVISLPFRLTCIGHVTTSGVWRNN